MDIAKFGVHHPPKHFWKPMINTSHHTKERSATHNQVEVSNDEVGVV